MPPIIEQEWHHEEGPDPEPLRAALIDAVRASLREADMSDESPPDPNC